MLERWKLSGEDYLPLFMLLSWAAFAAMILFVRVEFPALNNGTSSGDQVFSPKITLLSALQNTGSRHTAAQFLFFTKYAITPPLPPAQISAQKLMPAEKKPPLSSLGPPFVQEKNNFAVRRSSELLPQLMSLLPTVVDSTLPEVDIHAEGEIVFSAGPTLLSPLPTLPTISTETPLRPSIYQLELIAGGGVGLVLLLESSGRAEADRLGITLLRKMRFACDEENFPLPTILKARIFWPQTAYQSPLP